MIKYLYGPEITGQQEDYSDHTGDEAATPNSTEQVCTNRSNSEEKVEE